MNTPSEVIIGKPKVRQRISTRIRPSAFSWSTQMNLPVLKQVRLRSVDGGMSDRWVEPKI